MSEGKEPIGWVLSPGNTVDSFEFVTEDIEGLRAGSFVYYEKESVDESIMCRVREREDTNLAVDERPESFRSTVPNDLLSAIRDNDAHRFSVKILGIYDEEVGSFQNLRNPPRAGDGVYLTTSDALSEMVNPREKGEGGLRIGSLLNRSDVDVRLDLNEVATKHLGVLASTGAGKSYTVGVLLEEMVKPGNRGTSVVFDIHGEYWTLAENHEYSDRFNHIRLPRLKVSNLDVQDFEVAFPEGMNNVQRERLREILKSLDLGKKTLGLSINPLGDNVRVNYSLDDMRDKLSESSDVDNAIAWQLSTLKGFQSLAVENETSIEGMCEPGKCNIIEFPPGASEEERNLIVWHLTRRIFQARRRATRAKRGDFSGSGSNGRRRVDVPVMIVVEEAHNFAPVDRKVKTRRLLQEVAREGRKFGVGLTIVSQRPSRLDKDVLSQCNSNIIMKIKNDVDQMAIKRTVEAAGEDLIKDLPGLTVGQAVLAGSFVNTPVLAKIRERESRHGGGTPDVVEESVQAFRDVHEQSESGEETEKGEAVYED